MNDPQGSLWRKWDLHFHTPSSFDYQNKKITDEESIENLVKYEIKLVVVSDHHFIDVERIRRLQEIGRGRITILPGIEFRSELGGKDSVHFIGIFPEDSSIETIWTHLSGSLHIAPDDVKKKSNEKIYIDLTDAAAIIHREGGLVSIHAGRKSNSVENIANTEKFKMALKTDLLTGVVDILEVNRLEDIIDYRAKVFPEIHKELPIFICSDNHNALSYEMRMPCWVKGDPTFEGLRQTLYEIGRVFIGDSYPKQLAIQQNSTKFIRSILIHKLENAECTENWFDNTLIINPDLVAVIGKKGSGKSAIVDILGLLGNSSVDQEYFSFLHTNQFCRPNEKKAKDFEAVLEWQSKHTSCKLLSEHVDPNLSEFVRYIPQNYFEVICNEIADKEEGKFDKELKKVIYSHVSLSDRLGKESLDALINYKTEETENALFQLKREMTIANETIIRLEEQQSPKYSISLLQELEKQRKQLDALELEKPQEIPRPENSQNDEINEEIRRKLETLQLVQKEIEKTNLEIARTTSLLSSLELAEEKIVNFIEYYETFKMEFSERLKDTGINISEIIKLEINLQPIKDRIIDISSIKEKLDVTVGARDNNSLFSQETLLEKQLSDLRTQLDEPNRLYQNYIYQLDEWEEKRNKIIGDDNTVGTIKYYESKIKELNSIPKTLEKEKELRLAICKNIYQKIQRLSETNSKLFEPVQKFIQTHPLAQDKFDLNFDVSIIEKGFLAKFFGNYISHGAMGSFYGVEEGEKTLKCLISQFDFNNEADALSYPTVILEYLSRDKRIEHTDAVDLRSQLRKDAKIVDLYDYIFGLDYLRPRYILKMGEKEINQLSPGEKGALLLVFYLLIDNDDIPLIIDQPEHNLDNETIYALLVDCIKEAKKRRQVIIVTHNPNLAVVCDAEQIIIASMDKKNGNRIKYTSGAIENPQINKRVIDILEGTRPAFDKRRFKYIEERE